MEGISVKAANEALNLAQFVSENGRITDPKNIEEWAIEIEFEAGERGYEDDMIADIGAWMRHEFVPRT